MEKFCDSQRQLLRLENETEMAESTTLLSTETPQELVNRGIAILGLTMSEFSAGLFGKNIVRFQHHLAFSKKHCHEQLSQNSLTSGDIVGIFGDSFSSPPIYTGVVNDIDLKSVSIVLDKEDDGPKLWDYPRFNIAKIGSNVTHKRLMLTVNDLEKSLHPLVHFLFDNDTDQIASKSRADDDFTLFSEISNDLNDPQKQAVLHALTNPLITVCLGPPGTGKTTTLAAFIAESVWRNPGIKILACAPSNVAVDNLATRVLRAGVKNIMRVGHPTRVDQEIQSRTLDALVEGGDFKQSCLDIKAEISDILKSRKGFSELKELRRELRSRQAKSIEQIFQQSSVVFATCNGSFNLVSRLLGDSKSSSFQFDVCVIDECAQGLEVSSWIPILQSKRVVLGGDHKQLSATIKSDEASRRGLSLTLFERAFERFRKSEGVVNMLTIQYRMNEVIMNWSNYQFYQEKLIAHHSVRNQILTAPNSLENINGLEMTDIITSPFVFCDTASVEGMAEDETSSSQSKSNVGETIIVCKYVQLLSRGIAADISVITPYQKQAELIRDRLSEDPQVQATVEVSTVDSFQGRESEVVVISLTRSNKDRIVGFLSDQRRLNVAVTRAKKQVFIVGDSETISSDPILKTLFEYGCNHGYVFSAESFVGEEEKSLGSSIRTLHKRAVLQNNERSKHVNTKAVPQIPPVPEPDNFEHLRDDLNKIPLNEKFFFPNSLNNSERRYLHSLCEDKGYLHGSVGEGNERQIWIHKKSQDRAPVTFQSKVLDVFPNKSGLVAQPRVETVPKKKHPAKTPKPVDEVSLTKPVGLCPHATCPMSTKLVSLGCLLCGKAFCIAHATPEAHGCGDAAKQKARKEAKEAFNKLKSPPMIQGKAGVSTPAVRSKMDAKLEEMKKKRTSQKK